MTTKCWNTFFSQFNKHFHLKWIVVDSIRIDSLNLPQDSSNKNECCWIIFIKIVFKCYWTIKVAIIHHFYMVFGFSKIKCFTSIVNSWNCHCLYGSLLHSIPFHRLCAIVMLICVIFSLLLPVGRFIQIYIYINIYGLNSI